MSTDNHERAAMSTSIVRFTMFISTLTLVNWLIIIKWNPEVNVNLKGRALARKNKNDVNGAKNTATSGNVFHISKIRSYDASQLRFQSGSNSQRRASEQELGYWPQGEFWNRPDCKNWGAATTIFPPTAAVEQFVALDGGWCLVVAGDVKGPASYNVSDQYADKLVFLSRERQEELAEHLAFVKKTPWNHFARKNVAYLYAIANGAQHIWDFDDDNILFPNETLSRYTNATEHTTVISIDTMNNAECGVFNPYAFFRSSEEGVWPRGYPLDMINAPECQLSSNYCTRDIPTDKIGIYQSLADKDPDVDAVYRLTRRLPITFAGADQDLPVLVPPHTMSPMNAQATLFSQMGMWSMFLPTTVHGRVSDIWRSYIAQAVGKTCGMLVTFVGPHVVQDRNVHNFLADMEAEKQLYERSGSLISYLLDQWRYDDPEATLEGAWERLFVDLYERGIVGLQDVELAQLWISSLQLIRYKFPSADPSRMDLKQIAKQEETDRDCKEWESNPSQKVALSQGTTAGNRTCELSNVVFVGQFNFNMKARLVLHWIKRWRKVFRHVEVRGPFDDITMTSLQDAGVNVFRAAADRGWYSPMKNLGDSLRLHASNPKICGVAIAHDDMLVNISRLKELGFPSDGTIFSELPTEKMMKPFFAIYPNETLFIHQQNGKLAQGDRYKALQGEWHWRKILPNITRAVAAAPGRESYLRSDGGMDVYRFGQADFLYIPTSMTERYASHAEWMTENEVMLEVGVPTILAKLISETNARHEMVTVCSEWNYRIRSNASSWLPNCFKAEPAFGIFHPVKLTLVRKGRWDYYFDKIVRGKIA